jgi:hypothetical protein
VIYKEDNPVRFTKYFVVFGLCLLMGSCPFGPEIDIGDYEYYLEEWNRQNLLDYTLVLSCSDYRGGYIIKQKQAVITVRNGVPVSSDHPEWLTSGEMSTVPEFFSFIKEEEKRMKKANSSNELFAGYDIVYYYPNVIERSVRGGIQNTEPDPVWIWRIKLAPPEEYEQGNEER